MIKSVFRFEFNFIPNLEDPLFEDLEIKFNGIRLEYDKFEVNYIQNSQYFYSYTEHNLGYLNGNLTIKKDKCPQILYDFHYLTNYMEDYWKDLDYISLYFYNLENIIEEPEYILLLDITKNTLRKLKENLT